MVLGTGTYTIIESHSSAEARGSECRDSELRKKDLRAHFSGLRVSSGSSIGDFAFEILFSVLGKFMLSRFKFALIPFMPSLVQKQCPRCTQALHTIISSRANPSETDYEIAFIDLNNGSILRQSNCGSAPTMASPVLPVLDDLACSCMLAIMCHQGCCSQRRNEEGME